MNVREEQEEKSEVRDQRREIRSGEQRAESGSYATALQGLRQSAQSADASPARNFVLLVSWWLLPRSSTLSLLLAFLAVEIAAGLRPRNCSAQHAMTGGVVLLVSWCLLPRPAALIPPCDSVVIS